MFHYFFVARKQYAGAPSGAPPSIKVLTCYPKPVSELLDAHPKVADFCFPEVSQDAAVRTARFTFTLTDKNGGWLYGFCVRPTTRQSNSMDSLCILSPNPWFDLFYEVLGYAELQYAYGTQGDVAQALLKTSPLPSPGERFAVVTPENRFYVTRPPDAFLLVDAPIPEFFSTFGVSLGLDLIGAVLEERHILIAGDDLDVVTGCIHALTALIYPLQWHHPYVPVLPPAMLDAICSPTPFVMGIHSEILEKAAALPTENVVFGDTRRGTVTGLGEERLQIPTSVARLKDKIKDAMEKKGRSKQERCTQSLLAMADFMASVFGRVREFPITTPNRKGEEEQDFDDEKFTNIWANDKRVYKFVRTLIGTQGYQLWKAEAALKWHRLERDTFAERAFLKYPALYDGYETDAVADRDKSSSLFSRLGRAKDVVMKNVDKRLKKGEVSAGGERPPRATSPASSPERHVSSGNVSPTAGSSGADRSWLDDVGSGGMSPSGTHLVDPSTFPVLAADFPGDFIYLHTSLHPFNVHEPLNSVRASGQAAAAVSSPRRPEPPRGSVKDLVVSKLDGRVGCKYVGNSVTDVVPGSGADRAGLKGGMRMVGLNGAELPDDSRLVKAMLDSAPARFTLSVMYVVNPSSAPAGASYMARSPAGIPEQHDLSSVPPVTLKPAAQQQQQQQQQVQPAPAQQPPAPTPTPAPASGGAAGAVHPAAKDNTSLDAYFAPIAAQPRANTAPQVASTPAPQPAPQNAMDLESMFSAPTVQEVEAAKAAAELAAQPIDPFSPDPLPQKQQQSAALSPF